MFPRASLGDIYVTSANVHDYLTVDGGRKGRTDVLVLAFLEVLSERFRHPCKFGVVRSVHWNVARQTCPQF